MNAAVAPKPYPLNLRAIYIANSQTTIGEDFDPLLAGQPLVGWHIAQPDDARLNVLPTGSAGALRALEFRTSFEFIYRTPKVGQAVFEETIGHVAKPSLVPPENFDGMRLAAKVSATLVASFLLTEDAPAPEQAAIVALAQTTVLQVSWPYWREFCQTAFHRMQMPQTLIPLLTITQQHPPVPPVASPEPGAVEVQSAAKRKRVK